MWSYDICEWLLTHSILSRAIQEVQILETRCDRDCRIRAFQTGGGTNIRVVYDVVYLWLECIDLGEKLRRVSIFCVHYAIFAVPDS